MVIAGSTWSTSSVNALLAGLIGIAATLLGSLTTYLFQSRTAERARSFERDERLRYEQVNACSAFASAWAWQSSSRWIQIRLTGCYAADTAAVWDA